jgi:hypothetical protein
MRTEFNWVCRFTDAVKRPPNLSVQFFYWTLRSRNKTNSPSLFLGVELLVRPAFLVLPAFLVRPFFHFLLAGVLLAVPTPLGRRRPALSVIIRALLVHYVCAVP